MARPTRRVVSVRDLTPEQRAVVLALLAMARGIAERKAKAA